MNDDLNDRFLETAVSLMEKMQAIRDIDPMGDFCVKGQNCRTNIDRLANLKAWVYRLKSKSLPVLSTSGQVYRVHGANGQGASYISICHETGFVGVNGDYINFTYVSDPAHRAIPLVPFLRGLSQSYMLDRALGRTWKVPDFSPIENAMRKEILCRRKGRRGDADQDLIMIDTFDSREAWGDLDYACDADTYDEFYARISGNEILASILHEGEFWYQPMKPSRMADLFWNEVWVPFIQSLPDQP